MSVATASFRGWRLDCRNKQAQALFKQLQTYLSIHRKAYVDLIDNRLRFVGGVSRVLNERPPWPAASVNLSLPPPPACLGSRAAMVPVQVGQFHQAWHIKVVRTWTELMWIMIT